MILALHVPFSEEGLKDSEPPVNGYPSTKARQGTGDFMTSETCARTNLHTLSAACAILYIHVCTGYMHVLRETCLLAH